MLDGDSKVSTPCVRKVIQRAVKLQDVARGLRRRGAVNFRSQIPKVRPALPLLLATRSCTESLRIAKSASEGIRTGRTYLAAYEH